MFKTASRIGLIMGLVLVPSLSSAAVEVRGIPAADRDPHLQLVDLETLTDRDRRRLDFYASKIVEEITAISTLEESGDQQGVDSKLDTTRTMADRFTISSEELGLTAEEARQYFLVHMMGNFSGRLPEAFVGTTGIFDLNLLFVETDTQTTGTAPTGDYVDLLRNQTVGGVVPTE
jgi:hypothetical protein